MAKWRGNKNGGEAQVVGECTQVTYRDSSSQQQKIRFGLVTKVKRSQIPVQHHVFVRINPGWVELLSGEKSERKVECEPFYTIFQHAGHVFSASLTFSVLVQLTPAMGEYW